VSRLRPRPPANVSLVVAPAGYGKTTLAREWLNDRPHGWYRGNSATADVAALALGLARAASSIIPDAAERLTTRLRVSSGPSDEVEPLAELLAEDLAAWPEDAWLVFDDYHFACDSEPSERFVAHLAASCPLRLLIASRSRPSWATARQLLYGEIFEIGRNLLAMNQEEAQSALTHLAADERGGLISLADGWPALLGLAAVSENFGLPSPGVPHDLYSHFLDELYQGLQPALRQELRLLALTPTVTPETAQAVVGNRAQAVLREVLQTGLLQSSASEGYELHPLLRGFLIAQFTQTEDDPKGEAIAQLVQTFVLRHEWDQAFEVVNEHFDEKIFAVLLEAALPRMVDEARLPTLAKWIEASVARGFDSPLLDLAESEVALKKGDLRRAEATATRAWQRLPADDPRTSKALWLAGTSAHLAWRDHDALGYFRQGEQAATTETDVLQALWGQFLATEALDLEAEAAKILTEFISRSGDSIDESFRIATGRFRMALLTGRTLDVLDAHAPLSSLANRCRDPLILSSFLHIYLVLLTLAGRYEEALVPARKQLELARAYSLEFVVPLSYGHIAAASWGVRDFRACMSYIAEAETANHGVTSGELVMSNMAILRAKLFLARQAMDKAAAALDDRYAAATKCLIHAEYLAWWSLVYACATEGKEAQALADRADAMSSRIDVIGVTNWTRALLDTGTDALARAFAAMWDIGHLDAFVATYRARPEILRALADDGGHRDALRMVLEASRDFRLAEIAGLRLRPSECSNSILTKREREVLELICQGLTNREIGRTLYIEETTVKAHVRAICKKLGVRSRTEAAMRAAELAG
jgi:ATP/maltotriose-dependent transcriptional regulator MalT